MSQGKRLLAKDMYGLATVLSMVALRKRGFKRNLGKKIKFLLKIDMRVRFYYRLAQILLRLKCFKSLKI